MILKVDIQSILSKLLSQEDTDGDKRITIEDKGPKSFKLQTIDHHEIVIQGTYHLSNLLQELAIAKRNGQNTATIDLNRIEELPAKRISRMIRDYYWDGLTRSMDEIGITNLIADTKNKSLTADKLPVYIPFNDSLAQAYYNQLAETLDIKVKILPENITPEYVKSINAQPGILSLKLLEKDHNITAVPFVVPGGRFNEMYGWDSYFEAVGLVIDGRIELAKAMADNFQYEIHHYGKILNANRSYYLTRTQPPFYSSLIKLVFEKIQDKDWLKSHLITAINEYEDVWMVSGERLTENGLNRYLANGIGIPPETEEGHFDAAIRPYAQKAGIDISEYIRQYQTGEIINDDLDIYFVDDRSMRESGHDTSNRLDGKCSSIVPVELNAFLYKYETDFAELIATHFEDKLEVGRKHYSSAYWTDKATYRQTLVNQFLWNDKEHLYLDYNLKTSKQENYVSATALMPLWSGMCSDEQAKELIHTALPLLKENGGIASCAKESRGPIDQQHPQRQWDYPYGWAPHQMMIWTGLLNYGYRKEAEELIYRWLYMITKNAVDYNGTIPEKYDVVKATHKVFAEYGNVGTDFNYITQEGFGWMNASYQFGLSLLNKSLTDNLNNLIEPDSIF